MKRIIRGTFASYKGKDDARLCDLHILAKVLKNWGDTPKTINNTRAFELALLAEHYLLLTKPKRKRKANRSAAS